MSALMAGRMTISTMKTEGFYSICDENCRELASLTGAKSNFNMRV